LFSSDRREIVTEKCSSRRSTKPSPTANRVLTGVATPSRSETLLSRFAQAERISRTTALTSQSSA